MFSLLVVVAAVQLATAAVAVLVASQRQTDTQCQLVKSSMYQSAQVAQLAQVSLTAATLAEAVRNQVSLAVAQESEVAAVKAVNVQ